MNISLISRKNKELLAVALLLNIAAAGWYAFLFIEVKDKNEHISDLANQIEVESGKAQTEQSLKSLIENTKPLRDKLKGYTIEKESPVSFLEFIEATGRNAGVLVSIDSVEESDVPGSTLIVQLNLSVKAAGSWSGIIRFLGLLEFLPYEVRIEQLTVSKGDTRGGSWNINLSLTALKEK